MPAVLEQVGRVRLAVDEIHHVQGDAADDPRGRAGGLPADNISAVLEEIDDRETALGGQLLEADIQGGDRVAVALPADRVGEAQLGDQGCGIEVGTVHEDDPDVPGGRHGVDDGRHVGRDLVDQAGQVCPG